MLKPSAASPQLLRHTGPALVFDSNAEMLAAVNDPDLDVDENTVLVLRNGGPVGAPGMPEWGNLPIPKKLLQRGVRDMLRISDARMSGTHYGTCVLHVAPESAVGGPLALLKTGDLVALDIGQRRLDMLVAQTSDLLSNPFRARLAQPGTPLGTWLMSGTSSTAEAMGRAGFDWLLVDQEHVPMDEKDTLHVLQAIAGTRAAPVVRLAANEMVLFKRALPQARHPMRHRRAHARGRLQLRVHGLRLRGGRLRHGNDDAPGHGLHRRHPPQPRAGLRKQRLLTCAPFSSTTTNQEPNRCFRDSLLQPPAAPSAPPCWPRQHTPSSPTPTSPSR